MGRINPHQSSLWLKLVGWLCIAVGLLGIVLPIIPGIPLLIVGLVTLSTQHRWARALLLWAKRRFRNLFPRRAHKQRETPTADRSVNQGSKAFWSKP